MIRFAVRFSVLSLSLVALTFGVSWPVSQVDAQAKKIVHAGEGDKQPPLDPDWQKKEEFKQFERLRKGEQDRLDEAILDKAAQWYAYRLARTDATKKSMHELVKEAFDQIIDPKSLRSEPSPQQRAFMEEFGKRLTARLHEVVKHPEVIVRVNAAIILARLAATGQEDATMVLAEVLGDEKENDAVKLYALRGLRDFFALGHGDNPVSFNKKDREERENRCIDALLKYLESKASLPESASSQDRGVLHYVRPEAIAALGQTRYPALCKTDAKKKTTTVERRTALALLRLARKDDSVRVEPTVTEQVAAVVGLSQLESKLCPEYQADYVAYHIGRFLVEFGTAYNSGREEKTTEPWKIHALRLHQALADLIADTATDKELNGYISALARQADPILADVMAARGTDPTHLDTWLNANPPEKRENTNPPQKGHTSVYKDVPDSEIKVSDKSE